MYSARPTPSVKGAYDADAAAWLDSSTSALASVVLPENANLMEEWNNGITMGYTMMYICICICIYI